jgi:glycosyltransferase involved in cell wall biosynthesis
VRVAVTVDPYLPVPPRLYGGIERVVDLLVRELDARGHRVTLFAHPDSQTAGALCPYGVPPHRSAVSRVRELAQVGGALVSGRDSFDVVHSFGRLAALAPLLPMRRLPKIQSYQREVPWRGVRRAAALGVDSLVVTDSTTRRNHCTNWVTAAGEWGTV